LYRTARGAAEMRTRTLKREMRLCRQAMQQACQLQPEINLETLRARPMTLRARRLISDFRSLLATACAKNGRIVVPLDGRGFFLRGNGKAGSFAKLTRAVQESLGSGHRAPGDRCHDFTAPYRSKSVLRLELTIC
jgi:hypothetical protein